MSENVFGNRLRRADTAPHATDDPVLPDVLADVLVPDGEEDADTTQMVVIPVSQEIAPDFELIGYDDVIRYIEEVLTQRGKQRNAMLYGDNGVGKTAITHGLVQRKNRGDLSTHMFKRMFYRLNTSRLLHLDDVSEINRQFDQALEEFGRYDVMVIENFYTLMIYLKAKGANAIIIGLLEALSRRRLQCIITCNTKERALIVNEIPEIHEFFAPVKIPEPDEDQLLNILRGVHVSYENRYGVDLPDATLRTIRDLTQRFPQGLEGWAQPGRGLILLDRGIAQFSVRMNSKSPELAALEAELTTSEYEIVSLADSDATADNDRRQKLEARIAVITPQVRAMRAQWIETTAPIKALQIEKTDLDKKLHNHIRRRRQQENLRGDTAALIAQNTDASTVARNIARLNDLITKVRDNIREKDDELSKINLSEIRAHVVTSENMAETFSELSGIPTDTLNEDERERVLHMEEIMGERIVGQPQALAAVANAVRRARAKLTKDEETPKGSFLMLGPSGVGKTETGKTLAWFMTRSEKMLVRIDMSEFKEQHSRSRMIGAPPGYAGYDEGGVLTNAAINKPKSVIMLDEAEKAHPDIFEILLQVLGGARLTDGKGQTADFKETYILLTSNIGAEHFINPDLTFEQAEQLALRQVRAFWKPEFLGRLDGIICFHRLELPMLTRVAKRRIEQLNRGIAEDQLRLEVPDADIEKFCQAYQDPRYGARPILRAMKNTVEGDLATAILKRSSPGVFHGTFANDTLVVTFTPLKAA